MSLTGFFDSVCPGTTPTTKAVNRTVSAPMYPFSLRLSAREASLSGQVFMAAADVAMWLTIKMKLGMADSSVTA